jgi:HEPN domain-containing protein
VNRKELQALAVARVNDAKALLGRKRWAAAYYLAGYAVECGLKACVLRFVEDTGLIFGQKDGLKRLAECWTHDLEKLVGIANLTRELQQARQQSEKFDEYWAVVKKWTEVSRYETKLEDQARELFEAITKPDDGVMRWIRSRW